MDVTQPLLTLNVAIQQMVAIARAVSVQSKLVVMDEPTSSLDEREVATLFDVDPPASSRTASRSSSSATGSTNSTPCATG